MPSPPRWRTGRPVPRPTPNLPAPGSPSRRHRCTRPAECSPRLATTGPEGPSQRDAQPGPDSRRCSASYSETPGEDHRRAGQSSPPQHRCRQPRDPPADGEPHPFVRAPPRAPPTPRRPGRPPEHEPRGRPPYPPRPSEPGQPDLDDRLSRTRPRARLGRLHVARDDPLRRGLPASPTNAVAFVEPHARRCRRHRHAAARAEAGTTVEDLPAGLQTPGQEAAKAAAPDAGADPAPSAAGTP